MKNQRGMTLFYWNGKFLFHQIKKKSYRVSEEHVLILLPPLVLTIKPHQLIHNAIDQNNQGVLRREVLKVKIATWPSY